MAMVLADPMIPFRRAVLGKRMGQAGDCGDADPLIHPVLRMTRVTGWTTTAMIRWTKMRRVLWYFDGDGDGYGVEAESVRMCLAAEGYVAEVGGAMM